MPDLWLAPLCFLLLPPQQKVVRSTFFLAKLRLNPKAFFFSSSSYKARVLNNLALLNRYNGSQHQTFQVSLLAIDRYGGSRVFLPRLKPLSRLSRDDILTRSPWLRLWSDRVAAPLSLQHHLAPAPAPALRAPAIFSLFPYSQPLIRLLQLLVSK